MGREFVAYTYCLSLTALYVLSLYMVPLRVRSLPRDDSLHIRWRLATASLATLLSLPACYITVGSLVVLPYKTISTYDVPSFLFIIGFRGDNMVQCIGIAFALMSLFYTGPIVTYLLVFAASWRYNIRYDGHLTLRRQERDGESRGMTFRDTRRYFTALYYEHVRPNWSLITFRAIIFAPVSEEIVFRALMLPVLAMAGDGSNSHRLAALCPAFFAVAHLHHLYEKVTKSGGPLSAAVAGTLVQAAYTGVFGYIASLLFLRSGSVVTPVIGHIYCNYMGLPDISFAGKGKELSFLYDYRVVLLLLHALGIVLFALAIGPLTMREVRTSLYWLP